MIWDTDIEQVIVSAIRDREVASGQRATLLHDVFTHNPQLAFRLAEELFEAESGASGRHEHAVAIAAAMFRDATGAGWQLLWPKFKSDGSFGMSVLEQAAHGQDSLPGLKNYPNTSSPSCTFGW